MKQPNQTQEANGITQQKLQYLWSPI